MMTRKAARRAAQSFLIMRLIMNHRRFNFKAMDLFFYFQSLDKRLTGPPGTGGLPNGDHAEEKRKRPSLSPRVPLETWTR